MNLLKIKNSIIKVLLETLVFNKTQRKVLKSKWVKLNLKKYVDKAIKKMDCFKSLEHKDSKIIWQYWHQGIENAPEIIKKCTDSIQKFHPEYEIKILSFDTIKDFVEIPDKFYKLLEEKKIPIAIFSDILRLNLLSKYGGMWIDSTIFLTGRIPDDILNSDFFVLKRDPKNDASRNAMSCFFIKSSSSNIWLNLIKEAIEQYWNENNYLINYFIFEHFSTMLAYYNNEMLQKWEEIPYYDMRKTGLFQKIIFDEFDFEKYNEIISQPNIHKLTYKNCPKEIKENSYYKKVM